MSHLKNPHTQPTAERASRPRRPAHNPSRRDRVSTFSDAVVTAYIHEISGRRHSSWANDDRGPARRRQRGEATRRGAAL